MSFFPIIQTLLPEETAYTVIHSSVEFPLDIIAERRCTEIGGGAPRRLRPFDKLRVKGSGVGDRVPGIGDGAPRRLRPFDKLRIKGSGVGDRGWRSAQAKVKVEEQMRHTNEAWFY